MTQPRSHHRALTELVAKHRDPLEAYAGSEKESATLAEALLEWARADEALDEEQSK